MKKLSVWVLVLAELISGAAFATSVPNTNVPQNNVGPSVKASFTNRLVEDKAYSIIGEIGANNWRFNATYGWQFTETQRLKVTGEYLWDYLNFAYFSSNSGTWTSQVGVGIDYQVDLFPAIAMKPQLDIELYGTHSPSKALGDVGGAVTLQGFQSFYTDQRRVAGSNARGAAPGITITPWRGSRLSAILNYDHVHYNSKYNTLQNDADGWGGTAKLTQAIMTSLDLSMTAAVRKPFNYYNATLFFTRVPLLKSWTLGLFAEYTDGKRTMPDSYNVGLTADYYLDQAREEYNCETPCTRAYRRGCRISEPVNDTLAYVATPAVYMPQVMAIPDNRTFYTPV